MVFVVLLHAILVVIVVVKQILTKEKIQIQIQIPKVILTPQAKIQVIIITDLIHGIFFGVK